MKNFLIGVIVGLLVAAGICAWRAVQPSLPSALAPPARELVGEPTETLDCKPVVVYRDRVKKDLGLPETVKKDPDKKVTASTKVPGDDRPHTVTPVYDIGTGSTDLYVRRDPLPWLALDPRLRPGVWYGSNDEQSGVIHGQARYEVVRTKRLKWGVLGTVETGGRFFIGAGGEFN